MSARGALLRADPENTSNDNYSGTTRGHDHVPSPDYIPQAHGIRPSAPLPFDATNVPHDNVNTPFDLERQRDLEEEKSAAELSYAARGQGDSNSNSGTPYYTGKGCCKVI